jgi:hypothetical protein
MIHPDIVSRVALDSWQMDASDLWVLMARAQVSESVSWLSSWLWRFRVSTWMTSGSVQQHCACCGVLLPSGTARLKFCSTRCRVRAHRFAGRSSEGGATPVEAEVARHQSELESMMSELAGFRRWYRRNRSMQILPPDLLRVQHLPRLPGRCGGGCSRGVGCRLTDGSVCLYAATRGERID